jgi:hypothetical protein
VIRVCSARVPSRILRVLFAAYLAAMLVYIGWIMAHEPFSFDAWNMALDTKARPFSAGHFFDYWRYEYTHSNPRIGQPLTYLAYKLEDFAVIATPLAYIALTLAITVLGLARWPFSRGKDLALWAVVTGIAWFALPELPKTLFNRAYGANYVYGCAIQLWFLVPLRLSRDGLSSRGACIAYALAGIVAGMCAEHTGPTLALFCVLYAWWRQRQTGARPLLLWSGAVGVVVGFAAIFFAPGQGERYEGLAQRTSMLGRVINHGLAGNLEILSNLVLAAAPVLALIAVLFAMSSSRTGSGSGSDDEDDRAPALRFIAVALVAATLMAMTLFVSPKAPGSRFYIASCALLLAGAVALADRAITSARQLAPFVALAVLSTAYTGFRTIPLYAHAKRDSDARIAALEAAAPGSVIVADAFEQVDESWWFYGDDFRDTKKRELVANYFGLGGVVFRAYDITAPLGIRSASFVARVTSDPPTCVDDHGGFALGSYKGFDLPGIFREMKVSVELLRERLPASTHLHQIDLAVDLGDPHVVLPRPTILVARWQPDRFEGHVGQIVRHGASHTRDVVLPKELRGGDLEIYVYLVGGEAKKLGTARDASLEYVPWKSGVYWALACGKDECFVIAATRQAA